MPGTVTGGDAAEPQTGLEIGHHRVLCGSRKPLASSSLGSYRRVRRGWWVLPGTWIPSRLLRERGLPGLCPTLLEGSGMSCRRGGGGSRKRKGAEVRPMGSTLLA